MTPLAIVWENLFQYFLKQVISLSSMAREIKPNLNENQTIIKESHL